MVTEAQFKGLMTFWEGKIAGVVQRWRSTAPAETKEIKKLWKKLHKWVVGQTEASSAAVIADGNQWEVYVPPLVISAMEEMAAPADIDLYRRGTQGERPRVVPAYIGVPPNRFGSGSSLEQHEEFVVLESSSAISRELHNLRQENVELRHKYDELRRDFDDLCAHLGVGDWVRGDRMSDGVGGPSSASGSGSHQDPQRVEARFDPAPLPGVPSIRTTIDNDVDMDEEPLAPEAIRLSMQPDDAVAEELDIGVEEEPKMAGPSGSSPPAINNDAHMDEVQPGPGAITLSGQTNEAEADGVDMRSAEASKMGEGSPNSPSRGLTPYVVMATPPGTGPESPKVSGATTKSPGLAEANEDRTDEVLKEDQSCPGAGSEVVNPSMAIDGAKPAEASDANPNPQVNVNSVAQLNTREEGSGGEIPSPVGPAEESDANAPQRRAMEVNGVLYIYGTQIEKRVRESKDPRFQDGNTIRQLWKAVESLTFNIADILRSATDRNWLVYVPPIAISAMEELASNVSGDYKRRMDRITVDDPRVFGSGWYCATPPPGMSHMAPVTDMAAPSASSEPGAALKVPPTMGHALSGARQSATASGPAHGVSFVLPHIGLVAMDENQSKELDVPPTPGSLGRNGQGASMTPHWEYLQESENDADHDQADSIDTSEEVDELEELVIPKAGKAKGRRRAEACNPIDDDNELHGPRVPSERVAKGQQAKGKQRVQASMASSSGPNNAKRRWVPAYIGALRRGMVFGLSMKVYRESSCSNRGRCLPKCMTFGRRTQSFMLCTTSFVSIWGHCDSVS
ncbi:uncharacterized protein B0H18DRAFT_960364 [Fomitopsis serialis]|uniref:uncharacterized protein n=1 Tax=Fomitopsis serialis TaxID=139415 RepID=UPI00200792CE|nr:uncharacterized protein B0H18DRAFT_960364 [Neoantrodia serialis]KAH9913400.1 hypothetical protein B0H18DRAFT_960364 [Neoantrodia serialis]